MPTPTNILRRGAMVFRNGWVGLTVEDEHTVLSVSEIESVRYRPAGTPGLWKLTLRMRSGESHRFAMDSAEPARAILEELFRRG
jgi:hypothetical protein